MSSPSHVKSRRSLASRRNNFEVILDCGGSTRIYAGVQRGRNRSCSHGYPRKRVPYSFPVDNDGYQRHTTAFWARSTLRDPRIVKPIWTISSSVSTSRIGGHGRTFLESFFLNRMAIQNKSTEESLETVVNEYQCWQEGYETKQVNWSQKWSYGGEVKIRGEYRSWKLNIESSWSCCYTWT